MSAMCVQNFDDSLSPAIHTRYRISLRSSSLREPRYPLLRVVLDLIIQRTTGVGCDIQANSGSAERALAYKKRTFDRPKPTKPVRLRDRKSLSPSMTCTSSSKDRNPPTQDTGGLIQGSFLGVVHGFRRTETKHFSPLGFPLTRLNSS